MTDTQNQILRIFLAAVAAGILVVGFGLDPAGLVLPERVDEPTASTTPAPDTATATVTSVVDGDTFRVLTGGERDVVRLIGIDTPEIDWSEEDEEVRADCFGFAAREYLEKRLDAKTVRLEPDSRQPIRDTYDRRLSYVYLDEGLINKTLLAEGYARVLTVGAGFNKEASFRSVEDTARQNERGRWRECQ